MLDRIALLITGEGAPPGAALLQGAHCSRAALLQGARLVINRAFASMLDRIALLITGEGVRRRRTPPGMHPAKGAPR
jgi:hypothetical protein